jgi:hypothetical protein
LLGLSRLTGAITAGVAALVLTAALALAFHAAPARAAALPPDLVALEQQMAQLQVNSERFSFQEELAFGALLGQGVPFALIIAGDGEASDSPPQASLYDELLGAPEEQTRVIGDTAYRYRSHAAEIDGGRGWVSAPRTSEEVDAGEAPSIDPGGILESDQAGAQGTFSKLIEQLNGALSIEEVAPVTVDDQRVIEFNAALNPAPVLAKLQAKSKTPEHPLSSPLESSPVRNPKAPATPAVTPSLELEVFIALNGLPVRVAVAFAYEGATISLRIDTLAINIPVHVTPPPARQTIAETQLKQIERRRATRAVARALRACRKLHGKQAALCRAQAKLKGKTLKSVVPL